MKTKTNKNENKEKNTLTIGFKDFSILITTFLYYYEIDREKFYNTIYEFIENFNNMDDRKKKIILEFWENLKNTTL